MSRRILYFYRKGRKLSQLWMFWELNLFSYKQNLENRRRQYYFKREDAIVKSVKKQGRRGSKKTWLLGIWLWILGSAKEDVGKVNRESKKIGKDFFFL